MRFIAITSGKGGVGKSTIAANISYLLSMYGYRVALFDADIGLANQDIILGVKPKYTLIDLLEGKASMEEVVIKINNNFLFIPGESGDEILRYKNSDILEKFFDGLKVVGELDFLIIDTGAGIGESVRSFVAAATDTIVVTMPDPSAIMDAYSMIKFCAKAHDEVFLVVNNVRSQKEAAEIYQKLETVAKKHIKSHLKLEFLGFIERSNLIEESSKKRELLVKAHPSCIAAIEMSEIVKKLTNSLTKDGEHIKETPNIAIFFKRLLQQI